MCKCCDKKVKKLENRNQGTTKDLDITVPVNKCQCEEDKTVSNSDADHHNLTVPNQISILTDLNKDLMLQISLLEMELETQKKIVQWLVAEKETWETTNENPSTQRKEQVKS